MIFYNLIKILLYRFKNYTFIKENYIALREKITEYLNIFTEYRMKLKIFKGKLQFIILKKSKFMN